MVDPATPGRRARPGVARRRARSIPSVVVAFLVVTATFPLILLCAVSVDAVRAIAWRKPWVAVRLAGVLWIYLAAETLGLFALGVTWLLGFPRTPQRRARMIARTYRVQSAWTAACYWPLRHLFGIRAEVEGAECIFPGPILLFVRHVSLAEVLIPPVFVANPHRLRLRYVMKRELLSDPCLDVGGCRLPNYFVARDSQDSAAEVAAVGRLGDGVSQQDEGVVIYPEGTRFRPDRLARALEALRDRDPTRYKRSRTLRNVLPPRTGGVLALLDAVPSADVVVCAHRGFEGFTYVRNFWSGELIGRTVHIRFWRIPRAEIPETRGARIEWLDRQWRQVDDWVSGLSDVSGELTA